MKGVFLIPGFLGEKKDVEPVVDCLSKAGFFVYVPIIKGHGTKDKIEGHEKWIECVKDKFNRFQEEFQEIYIIGFSMGGVLATSLFEKPNYKIKGLVLISPAFNHIYFNSININSIREGISFKKINFNTLYGVKEMKKLSELAKNEKWLKNVNRKTLIMQGLNDGIIRKDNLDYVCCHLHVEKEVKLYEGKHYILQNKALLRDICQFIGG